MENIIEAESRLLAEALNYVMDKLKRGKINEQEH